MSKIGKVVFTLLLLWTVNCIIQTIKHVGQYSFADYIVIICLIVIPFIIFFRYQANRSRRLAQLEAEAKAKAERDNEKIRNLQNGLPVLNVPSLFFGDAKLHYYSPAILLETESKLVGLNTQTHGSTRESFLFHDVSDEHIMNSVSTSKAIYDKITSTYNGQFAITSKNIIFMSQEKGFECRIDEIALAQLFSDGISIQSGENTYKIKLGDPNYCVAILNILRKN